MDIQLSAETRRRIGASLHSCSGGEAEGAKNATKKSSRFGKQAQTLSDREIEIVLAHIWATSRVPAADELKFLLSCRAGLRVGEIATMQMRSLVDASGRPRVMVEVLGRYSKNGKFRAIPMHDDIRDAVRKFRRAFPDQTNVAIMKSGDRIREQSTNALTKWFNRMYLMAGLKGCSSHSGRRTFISKLARTANSYDRSLLDVQLLAGHSSLSTTERYIEPSRDLKDLVSSLGSPITQIVTANSKGGE